MKKVKMLFSWIKPHLGLFLMICTMVIILPLTYSYYPQFTKYIFDLLGQPSDNPNTLPQFVLDFFGQYTGIKCVIVVCATLAVYQLLRGSCMFFNGYLKGRFSESIARDMRLKLYRKIQNLSTSYHNTVDSGDLIQRCTSDIDTIRGFVSNQMPNILYILVSLLSGGIQMAKIDVRIMLITIICIPVTTIASIFFFRFVSKKFEEIEEHEAKMTSVLEESVNGVRVVKAFAREDYEINRFNEKSETLSTENKKLSRIMGMYWGFSDGLVMLQYAATLGFCIYLAKSKAFGASDLITCISYISMLVYPIRNLGRIISDFGKASVASRRIDEVLSVDDEYVINGDKKPEIIGNIEFKNVSFKFDDTDKFLFNDITFDIKAGETIAFVGKTGSGKSTIASLLVRMLEYTGGSIKLDGVELKDIDKKWVRENVGIILQEPFLYQKTIYENIAIATKNAPKEKIYEAAKTAAIHQDILTFDKGYNTLVGEKGVTLSGGQKQRLSISRMLVLNKPIMIFDDSLSAVDTKTDLQIRNALKQKDEKLTSIIITHRITTAKEADKIIVIEDGKVANIGTHETLSKVPGLYKDLWDIQGALENEFVNLVNKTVSE